MRNIHDKREKRRKRVAMETEGRANPSSDLIYSLSKTGNFIVDEAQGNDMHQPSTARGQAVLSLFRCVMDMIRGDKALEPNDGHG